MSALFLRLSLCGVVVASLAGCGGGSNGGSSGGGGGGNGGGGSPTTVTYDFTSGVNPAVVATKIGTGAYTQATLTSGKLKISVPSGTSNFSVAYLCPPVTGQTPEPSHEYIYQNSTLDGTSFAGYCYEPGAAPQESFVTVVVDASAIQGGAYVLVDGSGDAWSPNPQSVSVGLPAGTYDVVVSVADAHFNPIALKILRKQTIPGNLNGGNEIVFATSDKMVPQPITYAGVPAGFTSGTQANYVTSEGYWISLGFSLTNQYPAIPAASVESGDYYSFDAGAGASLSPTVNEGVGFTLNTTTGGGPETFTFPSTWAYTGPTPAALPTFTINYQGFAGMQHVGQYAGLFWGTDQSDAISIDASANYQAGSTALAVPDLSAVTGFMAPPSSGTVVQWNAGMEQVVSSGLPSSLNEKSVGDSGTYIVP
jgi:hypothetical protein